MSFFRTHSFFILFLAAAILSLFSFLFISFYAHPATDDFTYAYKGMINPLFKGTISEYMNWNGRYFSNFLVLSNPIAYNSFSFYKWIPVSMLFLSIFAVCFLAGSIPFFVNKTKLKIILSLIITAAFLNNMPLISEGIYWYTGAVTYQSGIIFSLLMTALIIRWNHQLILIHKIIHYVLIFLFMFLASGTNEISMVISIFICGIIAYQKKDQHTKLFFIFSVLCGLLVYFAPGNSVRLSFFPDNHNFFYSAGMSIAQTIRFSIIWLSNGTLIIGGILWIIALKQVSEKEINDLKTILPSAKLILISGFTFIFMAAFLPYWSTGILGQHRTLNVACFFFVISFIFWLTTIILNNENYLQYIPGKEYQNYVIGLFFILIVFTGNGLQVNSDLISGRAASFDKQMEARYEIIRKANGPIYLPKIKNPPATLLILDITSDSRHWQNRCYSIYFGKDDYPVLMLGN
jgi:hypothetical protein